MNWTTPTLVEICIGLEINGYLLAEFWSRTTIGWANQGGSGGMSLRKTATKFEVNPSTVQRVARPFDGAEDASIAA
jgi:coenzyme PQQ precursor peptide PqqA